MTVVVTNMEQMVADAWGLGTIKHVWRPYEYYFNEFTFGAGTPYIVESVSDLLSQNATTSDVNSGSGHGSVPGAITLSPKTIEFTIKCDAKKGLDVTQKESALRRAFTVPPKSLSTWVGDYHSRGLFTHRSTWLRFMRPGWNDARILYARVTKFSLDSTYEGSIGLITAKVQMVAPDPLSYGYTVHVVQIPSGENYNWTQVGDHLDGYAPRIVVHGNTTNPKFSCTRWEWFQNKTREVQYNLTSNTGMDVDFRNRIVNLPGANLLLSKDRYFSIIPGEQNIAYSGGSGTRADYYIRDTWA